MIAWRTDRDAFEPGQWLRGRVYERRCDLSPDGTRFVYFAHQLHRGYALTALCAPPLFMAIELWKKDNCYAGGGVFDPDGTLRLNDDVAPYGEDEPAQSRRFERHGWIIVRQTRSDVWWERHLQDRVLLRRSSLFDASDKFEIDGVDLRGASSADFDQRGRLVYARNGKLFAESEELVDFNEMAPNEGAPAGTTESSAAR